MEEWKNLGVEKKGRLKEKMNKKTNEEDKSRDSSEGSSEDEFEKSTGSMLVEGLKEKIKEMDKVIDKKEREKVALGNLLSDKKRDYDSLKTHLEQVVEQMEQESTRLRSEKARLMDKLKLPESERSALEQEEKEIASLKKKIREDEGRLNYLQMENEELKQEVRDLQLEMEEVQDQFKDEETARVKEMKKELEQSLKSLRVVQYKLKKTERRLGVMEEEKRDHKGGNASSLTKVQALEEELKTAKEVSSKLQKKVEQNSKNYNDKTQERRLEEMKEQLKVTETELDLTKRRLETLEKKEKMMGKMSVTHCRSFSASQLREDDEESKMEKYKTQQLMERLNEAKNETVVLKDKLAEVTKDNEKLVCAVKYLKVKLNKEKTPTGLGEIPKTVSETSLERLETFQREEKMEKAINILQEKIGSFEEEKRKISEDLKKIKQENEKLKSELKENEAKVVTSTSDLLRKMHELEAINADLREEIRLNDEGSKEGGYVRSSHKGRDPEVDCRLLRKRLTFLEEKLLNMEDSIKEKEEKLKSHKMCESQMSSLRSEVEKVEALLKQKSQKCENLKSEMEIKMDKQIEKKINTHQENGNGFEKEAKRLKELIQKLEEDLTNANSTSKKYSKDVEHLRNEMNFLEQKQTEKDEKIIELKSKLEEEVRRGEKARWDLEASLDHRKSLEKTHTGRMKELENRLKEMENEGIKFEEDLKKLGVEGENLEKELEESRNENMAKNHKIMELNHKINEMTKNDGVEKLRQKVEELKRQLEKEEAMREDVTEHNATVIAQMSEKDAAIGRLEREIEDLNDELDLEIESRQKAEEKYEKLKEEICSFKSKIEENEGEIRRLTSVEEELRETSKSERKIIEKEKKELKSELKEVKSANNTYQEDLRRLKEEVKAMKKDLKKTKEEGRDVKKQKDDMKLYKEELKKVNIDLKEAKLELALSAEDLKEKNEELRKAEAELEKFKKESGRMTPFVADVNDSSTKNIEEKTKKLQNQLQKVKSDLDLNKEENKKLKEVLRHSETELKGATCELEFVKNEFSLCNKTQKQRFDRLGNENESLRNEVGTLKDELSETRENLNKLSEKMKLIENENRKSESLESELNETKMKLEDVAYKLNKEKENLNKRENEVKKLKDQINSLNVEIEKIKKEAKDSQNQLKSTKDKLKLKENSEATAKEEKQKFFKEAVSLRTEVEKIKKSNEKLQIEIKSKDNEMLKLKKELADVKNHWDRTKKETDTLRTSLTSLEQHSNELSDKTSKVFQCEKEIENLEKTKECLQMKLANEEASRSKQVCHLQNVLEEKNNTIHDLNVEVKKLKQVVIETKQKSLKLKSSPIDEAATKGDQVVELKDKLSNQGMELKRCKAQVSNLSEELMKSKEQLVKSKKELYCLEEETKTMKSKMIALKETEMTQQTLLKNHEVALLKLKQGGNNSDDRQKIIDKLIEKTSENEEKSRHLEEKKLFLEGQLKEEREKNVQIMNETQTRLKRSENDIKEKDKSISELLEQLAAKEFEIMEIKEKKNNIVNSGEKIEAATFEFQPVDEVEGVKQENKELKGKLKEMDDLKDSLVKMIDDKNKVLEENNKASDWLRRELEEMKVKLEQQQRHGPVFQTVSLSVFEALKSKLCEEEFLRRELQNKLRGLECWQASQQKSLFSSPINPHKQPLTLSKVSDMRSKFGENSGNKNNLAPNNTDAGKSLKDYSRLVDDLQLQLKQCNDLRISERKDFVLKLQHSNNLQPVSSNFESKKVQRKNEEISSLTAEIHSLKQELKQTTISHQQQLQQVNKNHYQNLQHLLQQNQEQTQQLKLKLQTKPVNSSQPYDPPNNPTTQSFNHTASPKFMNSIKIETNPLNDQQNFQNKNDHLLFSENKPQQTQKSQQFISINNHHQPPDNNYNPSHKITPNQPVVFDFDIRNQPYKQQQQQIFQSQHQQQQVFMPQQHHIHNNSQQYSMHFQPQMFVSQQKPYFNHPSNPSPNHPSNHPSNPTFQPFPQSFSPKNNQTRLYITTSNSGTASPKEGPDLRAKVLLSPNSAFTPHMMHANNNNHLIKCSPAWLQQQKQKNTLQNNQSNSSPPSQPTLQKLSQPTNVYFQPINDNFSAHQSRRRQRINTNINNKNSNYPRPQSSFNRKMSQTTLSSYPQSRSNSFHSRSFSDTECCQNVVNNINPTKLQEAKLIISNKLSQVE